MEFYLLGSSSSSRALIFGLSQHQTRFMLNMKEYLNRKQILKTTSFETGARHNFIFTQLRTLLIVEQSVCG